jgi:hypothetical protein
MIEKPGGRLMFSYGATREINGSTITCSGHNSPEEAVAACYRGDLNNGWRPTPLREKWWQLWRPAKYEPGLELALSQISVKSEPPIVGISRPGDFKEATAGHASDCAVHNMPAYPNGPCDCGFEPSSAIRESGDQV